VADRLEFQNPDGSFVLTEDGKRKKTFSQRRPDPKGPDSWIWGVEGVPVVPYRLPELIEAVANKRTIFIPEGEAKVDLLWGWNVPASCCAGGAKKWRAEHSEFLGGADVVILPDNDLPGRQHLDVVANALQDVADIIDWAKAGGTGEQLHELTAHTAKPWTQVFASLSYPTYPPRAFVPYRRRFLADPLV
jgi:hypothetical protein